MKSTNDLSRSDLLAKTVGINPSEPTAGPSSSARSPSSARPVSDRKITDADDIFERSTSSAPYLPDSNRYAGLAEPSSQPKSPSEKVAEIQQNLEGICESLSAKSGPGGSRLADPVPPWSQPNSSRQGMHEISQKVDSLIAALKLFQNISEMQVIVQDLKISNASSSKKEFERDQKELEVLADKTLNFTTVVVESFPSDFPAELEAKFLSHAGQILPVFAVFSKMVSKDLESFDNYFSRLSLDEMKKADAWMDNAGSVVELICNPGQSKSREEWVLADTGLETATQESVVMLAMFQKMFASDAA